MTCLYAGYLCWLIAKSQPSVPPPWTPIKPMPVATVRWHEPRGRH